MATGFQQIVAERGPVALDALRELVELMHGAAAGGIPRRDAATRYMQCRETLLRGPHRAALPGFLIQCGSLFKFAEFIVLYDPAIAERRAFVDAALADVRVSLQARPVRSTFDDLEF